MQKTSIIKRLLIRAAVLMVLLSPLFSYAQELSDSIPHKEYYKNGKVRAEGILYGGMKQGVWIYYYPNHLISAEERYRDDLLHGLRRTFDFNGKLQTLENWINGIEEDSSFSFYSNGQIYRKGIYQNGLYEGVWYTYYENGTLKNKGSYHMGNPEGDWVFWNEKGCKTHEGNYSHGRESGQWKLYNEKDGFLQFEGEYNEGKKVGEWKEYTKKGKVKRTFYP